jgi:hypothetical protein
MQAFGPMEDPLEVSEVLGKLGRRARDPAARRRAIAARIAILSLSGCAPSRQADIIAEVPEPVAIPAPLIMPEGSEPVVKKASGTKVVRAIVALENTSALFAAISLSDKAQKVTNPDLGEDPATEETLDEPRNITDGFDETNPLAQATESAAPVASPFDDQASNAQSADLDDVSHATKQSTSKVLNFADDSAVPPDTIDQPSVDGQTETEAGPAKRTSAKRPNAIPARRPSKQAYVADAKQPNKKRRGKQTISFNVSARANLLRDSPDENEGPT